MPKPPIDPFEYRRTMSRFATGVTVVTVIDAAASQAGRPQVHGITVSSFTSVSLEPTLVLVVIDKSAKTHDLLLNAERFAVSVLSEKQRHLSELFADRTTPEPEDPFTELAGHPVIAGALAQLVCRRLRNMDAGDHTVFLGEVEDLRFEPGGLPLIYFKSEYRGLSARRVSEMPEEARSPTGTTD